MVACACVAVVSVARGARARPVTTMDARANAHAWRFLGAGDDGAEAAACVARAMGAAKKCARETMDVARRAGEESVEEAVRELADARARCAADARDVVDACAEDARACAKTLRAIEEECEVRAREIARTCESGSGGAWACAMKAAESSRDCASRVAAEAAACVDDDDDDALDDPDDPDDDRAKCEAERKELEQECHDAYDEIKRKIRDGEISFIEGMKQLANLGKTCASKAMALRKKCRPPPPPRVAVTA